MWREIGPCTLEVTILQLYSNTTRGLNISYVFSIDTPNIRCMPCLQFVSLISRERAARHDTQDQQPQQRASSRGRGTARAEKQQPLASTTRQESDHRHYHASAALKVCLLHVILREIFYCYNRRPIMAAWMPTSTFSFQVVLAENVLVDLTVICEGRNSFATLVFPRVLFWSHKCYDYRQPTAVLTPRSSWKRRKVSSLS